MAPTNICRAPKLCQADNCLVDLGALSSWYYYKKKLCPKHIKADSLRCKHKPGLHRYCFQCGKLELLSQFDPGKRSCRMSLCRRRSTYSRNLSSNCNAALGGGRPTRQRSPRGSSTSRCPDSPSSCSSETDDLDQLPDSGQGPVMQQQQQQPPGSSKVLGAAFVSGMPQWSCWEDLPSLDLANEIADEAIIEALDVHDNRATPCQANAGATTASGTDCAAAAAAAAAFDASCQAGGKHGCSGAPLPPKQSHHIRVDFLHGQRIGADQLLCAIADDVCNGGHTPPGHAAAQRLASLAGVELQQPQPPRQPAAVAAAGNPGSMDVDGNAGMAAGLVSAPADGSAAGPVPASHVPMHFDCVADLEREIEDAMAQAASAALFSCAVAVASPAAAAGSNFSPVASSVHLGTGSTAAKSSTIYNAQQLHCHNKPAAPRLGAAPMDIANAHGQAGTAYRPYTAAPSQAASAAAALAAEAEAALDALRTVELQGLRQRYAVVTRMMRQIDSELEKMQKAFTAAQQSICPNSSNGTALQMW